MKEPPDIKQLDAEAKDALIVALWEEVQKLRKLVKKPIVFTAIYNADNIEQLDRSFVYYLMYDKARTIRPTDIEHIMPKSILEVMSYDRGKIDSIKNLQFLDPGTNRGVKNAKLFASWINNSEYVKDKKAFMKRHLIPVDEATWTENKFDLFLEERAKLILAKLDEHDA